MHKENFMDRIQLLEDKVTKFGGEVFPKFGWCCILAGGSGSGKGYTLKNYIPIEGRMFDPDAVKEKTIKKVRVVQSDLGNRLVYTTPAGEQVIDLDERGINPPYNTNNPKFTGLIHEISRPLVKKLKNFIFKGGNASNGRLPNIIFDCTMSDETDYDIIVPQMKSLGYKVAIVYVFTHIDVAVGQNKTRGTTNTPDGKGGIQYGRRVDYKTLLDTHEGFIRALRSIKGRPDIISKVDDIWAVISSRGTPPVIVSIKDGDKLNLSSVDKFIDDDYQRILSLQREYEKSADPDSYNEGVHVIGAYDLYEALKEMKKVDEE